MKRYQLLILLLIAFCTGYSLPELEDFTDTGVDCIDCLTSSKIPSAK